MAVARRPDPASESRQRRTIAVAVAGLLAAMSVVAVVVTQPGAGAEPVCGPGGQVLEGMPGPLVCAHADEPPPGVDVSDHVRTRELVSREGAGPAAYEAAEELGVPTSVASAAAGSAVSCDGDGDSGYRVQAMYVVEAGRSNRFAALQSSLQRWAAGADDVVNRSAAMSGGVRNVRYVTDTSPDGTCVARLLNVTVPAGSMTSFNATINAVKALGYESPARKYLMWTDATVLCGIATMYPNDLESQSNPNNGLYAQYARIDSGCWGFGDGAGQHSVEAHELAHNLGGVQNSAPHSTRVGHCWDEYDTMCYADGGAYAMKQICPPEREYLLDCNTDDYFSTYPDPGSYLDTHWNAADSRFLIGGGDGFGGGASGSPTVLGATIGVNNPAVPGLSTQVSVTPAIPDGRSLASVTWKSARADCNFGTPSALQSTVTCGATASSATTVTATLVDSTGATKAVTSPLTFATGTTRPVALSLAAAAQDGTPASVCTGAGFPVVATVTDAATGQPVKGLSVSFTKQTATMTAPSSAGAAASVLGGTATVTGAANVSTTYAARTAAGTVYAAGSATPVATVPGRCAPVLTGAANVEEVYYGDPVTVSGTLTRAVDGVTVPVGGVSLPVTLSYRSGTTNKVVTVGTAKTSADGSYTVAVRPTVTGALAVALVGSTAYTATSVPLGSVVVKLPSTELTATVDRTEVGYGDPVTVTGRLTKTAGELTTGVVGATVTVKVTPTGKAPATVGSGRTLADGTFRISVPLKLSGALSVTYAGAAGLPADSVVVGDVTASTWATAVSLSGTPAGTAVVLSGTVTKSYDGVTAPAKSLRLKVYLTPSATGVPVLVTSPTTTTSGTFSAKVYPQVAGSYTAVLTGITGYSDATSNAVSVG